MNTRKIIIAFLGMTIAVACLMTAYKEIYKKISKKDTTIVWLNKVIAVLLSYGATVLSWWSLDVPEDFKMTFIYFFMTYVLQEIFDLQVIKKIIKLIVAKNLEKKGLEKAKVEEILNDNK